MARKIKSLLRICGSLKALTSLHVGGLGADVDTDLPLARDGQGRFYVPGTSLAGALRGWCEDVKPALVRSLWGYQEKVKVNDSTKDDGQASRVFVEDAVLPEATAEEVRDGVGIDRVWGCAAEGIKYDRAVLPRGTELPLAMSVEILDDGNSTQELLAGLVEALKKGRVRFGAARTRGLGRVKLLDDVKITEDVVGTREGILARLAEKRPTTTLPNPTHARPLLVATIGWHPVGPLMVKAGLDGVGVDTLPLVSDIGDGKLAPVLPGSSIKGVLRGQAERIVRTMRGIPAAAIDDPKQRFLKHKRVELVEYLFGSTGRDDEEATRLGRGALGVDDCYAVAIRFTPEHWQRITLAAPDATDEHPSELRQKLGEAGVEDWTAAYHVAVDRWTDGAADGFLYSVLEPHGVAWEPIRIEIDPTRLPGCECEGLALLLLVMRDLAGGKLPLGFATHRGMGAIAIDDVSFQAAGCAAPFVGLDGVSLPGGRLEGLPAAVRSELNTAWKNWLAPRQKVTT